MSDRNIFSVSKSVYLINQNHQKKSSLPQKQPSFFLQEVYLHRIDITMTELKFQEFLYLFTHAQSDEEFLDLIVGRPFIRIFFFVKIRKIGRCCFL